MCASRVERSENISAARKTQILEAAREFFSVKGFSRASTAEIARKAGVSQGTVFYYFPTKYDLLIALINQYFSIEAVTNSLSGMPEENLQERLRALLQERLAVGFENIDVMLLILSEMQRDQRLLEEYAERVVKPVLGSLESFLCSSGIKGRKNGRNTSLTARFLLASIIGLVVIYRIEGEKGPLRSALSGEIAATLAHLILDGIGINCKPGDAGAWAG
jgi:AcrR family transcriptional regulator